MKKFKKKNDLGHVTFGRGFCYLLLGWCGSGARSSGTSFGKLVSFRFYTPFVLPGKQPDEIAGPDIDGSFDRVSLLVSCVFAFKRMADGS